MVQRMNAIRCWLDGDGTTDEIGADFGVCGGTIRYHITKYMVSASNGDRKLAYLKRHKSRIYGPQESKRGKRKLAPELQAEIMALGKTGLSSRKIADMIGVNRKRVFYYLKGPEWQEDYRRKSREYVRKVREDRKQEDALAVESM